MRNIAAALVILTIWVASGQLLAQVDEDELGAWYMYFFNAGAQSSRWGVQGDVQYRNWDLLGDLEQLLIRGGVTYTLPDGGPTFTLGYANITSGEFGPGDAKAPDGRPTLLVAERRVGFCADLIVGLSGSRPSPASRWREH